MNGNSRIIHQVNGVDVVQCVGCNTYGPALGHEQHQKVYEVGSDDFSISITPAHTLQLSHTWTRGTRTETSTRPLSFDESIALIQWAFDRAGDVFKASLLETVKASTSSTDEVLFDSLREQTENAKPIDITSSVTLHIPQTDE